MLQKLPRGAFGDPGEPRPPGSALDRPGRVMLVTMPPGLLPPFSLGNCLLHRLQVLMVGRGEVPDVPPSRVIRELPQLEANAVTSTQSRPLRHSRRLQGEILCDGAGRLYEKIGHFVQPIHQLVAGPRGEVLDLAPPRPAAARSREPVIDVEERPVVDASAWTPAPPQVDPTAGPDHEARSPAAGSRELPFSGGPRIVQFGEFKSVLSPQLLHPERLRDAHRLSCRVHVYESDRAQRIEALAAEIPLRAPGQILPLTPALGASLDLADLVPRRRQASMTNREPGVVLQGDRVVWLEVLSDPTAAIGAPPAGAGRTRDDPPAVSPAQRTPAEPVRGKTIPERFLVPWQFAVSRDEAIYDLNLEATRPRLRSLLDRMLGLVVNRGHLPKWQALLRGRSLDDQLWGVRPPRAGLSNPVIRDWARRMLEAAGYDPATMLFEWEVYWRRKQR